jgi:hypothetical protein
MTEWQTRQTISDKEIRKRIANLEEGIGVLDKRAKDGFNKELKSHWPIFKLWPSLQKVAAYFFKSSRGRFRKSSACLVLVMISVLLTVTRARTITPLESTTAAELQSPLACPFQTTEEWTQFINYWSNQKKWVETCEDSTCDADFYFQVKEGVAATFAACRSFLAQHKSILRCTDHLRRFTPTWMRQHDPNTYGFNVSNQIYLAEQEAPDKPAGMMQIPQPIVDAIPDRLKVEATARAHGWKYLTHDSALGGTRTFVLYRDPQGRFDQWMLLNLQDGKQRLANKGMPVSMIAVQKKTASGDSLAKVRLGFRDYTIDEISNGIGAQGKLSVNVNGNGKCYSCHASGMRQLIARRTKVLDARPVKGEPGFQPDNLDKNDKNGKNDSETDTDFSFQRLSEFNRIIRAYGQPDWDGKIIPEDHGPALGAAQGCTECHDGQSRGALTVSTSPAQIEQKMYHELAMPPDTNLPRWLERSQIQNPELNKVEAGLLHQAYKIHEELTLSLENSRFPELKRWMLEETCK